KGGPRKRARTRHLGAPMVGSQLAFRYFFLLAAFTAVPAPAADEAMSPSTGAWQFLRPQFYGEREIGEVDEAFMSIEAPVSTPDPAATPVSLRFGKGAVGSVRRVRVIIDNN